MLNSRFIADLKCDFNTYFGKGVSESAIENLIRELVEEDQTNFFAAENAFYEKLTSDLPSYGCDTCVREEFADRVSLKLTGLRIPSYGSNAVEIHNWCVATKAALEKLA